MNHPADWARIVRDWEEFRAKYDAENGGGSTDGALLFLARIMAACAANPRKQVGVWA